jgi:hypothetical protein
LVLTKGSTLEWVKKAESGEPVQRDFAAKTAKNLGKNLEELTAPPGESIILQKGEPGACESVLHFDQAETLVAILRDGEFHVVHPDVTEAQGFHQGVHNLVVHAPPTCYA